MSVPVTPDHIRQVLDIVRNTGQTAYAGPRSLVSTPVFAVAVNNGLNPVELQNAVNARRALDILDPPAR